MSEFIGPALPPGLGSAKNEEKEEEAVIGPDKSTSDVSIGPQLPPNLSTARTAGKRDDEPSELNTTASSFCGPRLPSSSVTSASGDGLPNTSASAGSASYGPSLPPGFGIDIRGEEESEQPPIISKIIGPSLPPSVSATEAETDEGGEEEERGWEDDVIGPMPMVGGVNEAESTVRRRREFESRSKAMKDKLLGKVHTHTHLQPRYNL